jgi:hypothetical protein
MTDLTYTTDGLWTHFHFKNEDGVKVYKQLLEAGMESVWTIHAKQVISDIRRAGYTITKAKKPSAKSLKFTAADDALLAELTA